MDADRVFHAKELNNMLTAFMQAVTLNHFAYEDL